MRYSPQPCSAATLTSARNASRFRWFCATFVREMGNAMMKMNARCIHVAGIVKGDTIDGLPSLANASMNTRCASSTASPVFGMIGENHRCPSEGDGFSSVRAPIEKIAMLGMPTATLWTRSNCSWRQRESQQLAVLKRRCRRRPRANRSLACSRCAAITFGEP